MAVIKWNIYEITTKNSSIHGVMFRGRIRKYGITQGRNILTENASDVENVVRFAIPSDEDASEIITFLKSLVSDCIVEKVKEGVENPVLSKMKVNIAERYEI